MAAESLNLARVECAVVKTNTGSAMPHGIHHFGPPGICGWQRRRFHSKKERIEMLGGIHMESLKCELEGVEEALKGLQIE